MKFGGSSLADAGRIRRVADLVRDAAGRAPRETPVVVVSAMGGVTDRLFTLARTALAGRTGQGAALEQVDELRRHHERALDALCEGAAPEDTRGEVAERLDAYFAELRDIVIGVSLLGELSPRSLDAIAAYGEKLSTLLVAAALRAATSAAGPGAVKAVTAIRDLALVTVEGLGMLGVPGIAGRTFGALAAAGVNVLMISQASSESNIAMVVARREVVAATRALREAFALELHRHEVDAVRAQEGVAIVTAVGGGMRGTPGVAGRLFGALGRVGVNVIAIAQGSSELSISCVVRDDHAVEDALRAIHHEFVEGAR